MITHPDGPLYRGLTAAPELRAATDTEASSYMEGHFAVFDQWTEIHSWYEGDFLERLSPGSFKRTINNNRDNIKVQFDHGYDVHIGNALLGPIDDLREDDIGAYYGVPLLDTDYNRDRILPLLQGRTMDGQMHGSLLGASFRFRVIKDEWDEEPGRSDHNPDGLPERTIREAAVFEFGPVVFPAYPDATAGIRSVCLTDHYLDRAREARSRQFDPPPALDGTGDDNPTDPPSGHSVVPRRGLLVAAAQTQLLARKG